VIYFHKIRRFITTFLCNLTKGNQAFHEAQRQRQVAESLREIAAILNHSLDQQTVLAKILEQMRRVIQHDGAGVFLQEGDNLVLSAGDVIDQAYIGVRISLAGSDPVARVFNQKQISIIGDVSRDPGWIDWPDEHSIQSWMGAPLLAGQQPIGVLTADGFRLDQFAQEEAQILQAFADQAAIAIQNARLFEAEHTALKQVETLYAASLALSSTIDLKQVLKVILSELRKVVPYDSASVQEQKGDYFEIIDGAGFDDLASIIGLRFQRRSQGFVHQLITTRNPIILSDVFAQPELQDHALFQAKIRSWLYVPLFFGDRIIGAISIDKREPDFFTPKHVHLALAFAAQAAIAIENARLFEREQAQRRVAEQHSRELAQALDHLKTTQQQLIHQEKMASLGMLTSRIAHEIKNPLNFVNNFAVMLIELAQEARAMVERQQPEAGPRAEVMTLLDDLIFNAAKINEQGQRADSIIQSMLLHSRNHTGQRQTVNLNSLAAEAVNFTYHSIRAKDDCFDVLIETDFDPTLEPFPMIPQDMSRVLVNLIDNATYAVRQKQARVVNSYKPCVRVKTKNLGDQAEIHIWDNGAGIPAEVRGKLFNPFFTTKPAGEGTGLGLSISYDIIIQGHGGAIEVDSVEGEFTEFIIWLPKC
jgi:signal transduction histidine kinase